MESWYDYYTILSPYIDDLVASKAAYPTVLELGQRSDALGMAQHHSLALARLSVSELCRRSGFDEPVHSLPSRRSLATMT